MCGNQEVTEMWASQDEVVARFHEETLPRFDFRVRDEWDNGEFLTGATVDLLEGGKVVHTETFVASSEDAPGDSFSEFGNGRDNHAGTQARSYAWAWLDGKQGSLEDRLAPFGAEWEREQAESHAVYA